MKLPPRRREAGEKPPTPPVEPPHPRSVPAGLDAQITVEGVPPVVLAGTRHPVRATVRNTGSLAFDPVGPDPYAYRLGVRARTGPAGWPPDRLDLRTPLLPGEAVTLPAHLTAPSEGGSYEVEWRMILEMVEWCGAPSAPVVVRVEPLDVEVVCLDTPSAMVAGRRYVFNLQARNRSLLPLGPVGCQPLAFRLGLVGRGLETWGVQRADFVEPLAPGHTVSVRHFALCLAEPGSYHLQWQLLQEGSSWLGDPSVPLALNVLSPPSGWTAENARDHFGPLGSGEPVIPTYGDVEEVLNSHWRLLSGKSDDAD
jgi:hypothetical protein